MDFDLGKYGLLISEKKFQNDRSWKNPEKETGRQ